MPSDDVVQNATKELRRRLALSQTEFGRKIGRTLNTVVKYENQIRAKDEALVPYGVLALDSGFYDLAEVFRTAVLEDLGSDLERLIDWRPGEKAAAVPKDMSKLVGAFVVFMTSEDLSPAEVFLRDTIRRILLDDGKSHHHKVQSGERKK